MLASQPLLPHAELPERKLRFFRPRIRADSGFLRIFVFQTVRFVCHSDLPSPLCSCSRACGLRPNHPTTPITPTPCRKNVIPCYAAIRRSSTAQCRRPETPTAESPISTSRTSAANAGAPHSPRKTCVSPDWRSAIATLRHCGCCGPRSVVRQVPNRCPAPTEEPTEPGCSNSTPRNRCAPIAPRSG